MMINLKIRLLVAVFLSISLVMLPASGSAETPDVAIGLKQDLQKCTGEKKLEVRVKCFQRVAESAIGVLERIPLKPVKSEEELKRERDIAARKEVLEKNKDFVAKAKAALTESFKDPQSVQYRGLFIGDDDGSGALRFLCGEVNGKNSYGAYIGFKRFYASDLGISMVDSKDNNFVFNGMYPKTCKVRLVELVD